MDSAFMVVNENFHHMTLDSIQRHAAPLSSEESGFVMGQVFEGLNYLHEQRWAHGNVDPCSILVLSRDSLFIKLADTALSGMAGLGKPEGYHDFYASQKIIPGLDQYPGDIWSAGVVGLHLVHGSLPGRTQYTSSSQSRYVAQLETYLKSLTRKQSSNDALRFLTRVMKYKPPDRPTAKELLEDSWIQDTRHYKALQLPVSRPTTPQASRHPSAGPSNTFSRQSSAGPLKSMNRGEDAPRSRPTSVGPSSNLSRQSSTDPTFRAQSHPYPGDDFNDFDSKHGTTVSRSSRITANPLAQMGRTSIEYESDDNASPPDRERSSRSQSHSNGGGRSLTIGSQHGETASQSSDFTANPLAREPRTPTPYYSDDHSGRLDPLRTQPRSSGGRSPAIGSKHGSIISRSSRYTANPPSRTSHASSKYDSDDNSSVAGPGSLRSQSRSGSGEFPVNDQATGTIGPEHSQKEAEIEKDSGEETETDGHRTPVPKKPCRGVVVPPLEMNLRSRGNGRR